MPRSTRTLLAGAASTLLVAGALPAGAADAPAGAGLGDLIQVAIVTKDIEASAARWAAVLGQPVPEARTTRPGREVEVLFRGQPSDARVKLAFLRAGSLTVELLEPVGGPSAWTEGLDTLGERVHHVGFAVKDVDASVSALERMGYPVVQRGRYDSEDGTYVYVDSTAGLGVMLELLHSDKE